MYHAVIDLSSIEPESLGPLHLEEIPLCSFTEKGRPYKPKSKKSKKKWRKEEEHRSKRKADIMVDLETRRSSGKDQGGEVRPLVFILTVLGFAFGNALLKDVTDPNWPFVYLALGPLSSWHQCSY